MNAQDIVLIRQYKRAGWSDLQVAAKLGVSVEEVRLAWKVMQEMEQDAQMSGYSELMGLLGCAAEQFRNFGLLLRVLVESVGDLMPPAELASLITEDRETTMKNLLQKAIVLRPFDKKRLERAQAEALGLDPEKN